MKNCYRFILIRVLFFATIIGFAQVARAQSDLDQYLRAGIEDAEKLTESYISPLIKGFGYGTSNGWYNTAKAHQSFGVDFTINASAVFVPSEDKFYTFRNSDYNNIRLADGQSGQLPTAFGPSSPGPELVSFDEDGNEIGRFNAPEGVGFEEEIGVNAIPVPMLQLGIGLVKNTDLKLRYIPTTDFGDGQVKLFGVGLMHDIKQWIPGVKLLPFDFSVLFGHTTLSATYDLTGNVKGKDQEGLFKARSMTIQGVISKKISVLTLYGAIGYNKVQSNINVNGEYVIEDDFNEEVYTFIDPIAMEVTDGGMRATAGLRLKFAIFTLHADYTLNKYPMATVGLGFSVN